MQKLTLTQSLGQRLSPQQIQFIKLLQVPTAELDSRIEEELEINPALEEGKDEPDTLEDEYGEEESSKDDEIDIDDYLQDDDYADYKTRGDSGGQEEEREMPIAMSTTLNDQLMTQLGYLGLDERQEK